MWWCATYDKTTAAVTMSAWSLVAAHLEHCRAQIDKAPGLHPLRSRRQAVARRTAEAYFQGDDNRARLTHIFSQSISTGAGWADYHLLHHYITS